MIVVRVELRSHRTGKVTQLARMTLTNEGGHTGDLLADYSGRVLRKPNFERVTREGMVLSHRRKDLPVWTLIRKMLESMGY